MILGICLIILFIIIFCLSAVSEKMEIDSEDKLNVSETDFLKFKLRNKEEELTKANKRYNYVNKKLDKRQQIINLSFVELDKYLSNDCQDDDLVVNAYEILQKYTESAFRD